MKELWMDFDAVEKAEKRCVDGSETRKERLDRGCFDCREPGKRRTGKLSPETEASRTQVATMLMRYCTAIESTQ